MTNIEILIYLALFLACLFASGFFMSAEIAFMSLQRIKLEHMLNTKVPGAARVARLLKHPAKLLSVILLANNLVQSLATVAITVVAISLLGEKQGALAATIVATVFILIFAEATPKTVAAHHSERMSLLLAPPLEIIAWLLTPFVVVLSWVASQLSKMFGGTPIPRSLATEEEIRTMIYVAQRDGTVEEDKAKMLANIFEFTDRPAREVMVPRNEVVWVEKGTNLADFLTIYINNPLSRFPMYEDSRDNVIGIISIKDVLMALAKGTVNNQSLIDDLARPPFFAPETKHINELFAEMQAGDHRLAVIVDEYGGTVGVVSLSLLLEKIVGPLEDELEGIEKDYEVISANTYQVDGSMRIDEANQEMGLALPKGDYETVAGFIITLLGHIPRVNESLKYKGLKIVVTEMRGLKIEKILVTKEAPNLKP
ncbi:MAG: HlyC/CorC family transporter [Chloroflexi bacterium]|nr:HlyC/CorC family transporter [Chloroflexota bacterium]